MDKKDKNTAKEKILSDEDFIHCPRLGNSLKNLIDKNPEGIDDERISKVLLISEEEVKKLYNSALEKFRKIMGVKID